MGVVWHLCPQRVPFRGRWLLTLEPLFKSEKAIRWIDHDKGKREMAEGEIGMETATTLALAKLKDAMVVDVTIRLSKESAKELLTLLATEYGCCGKGQTLERILREAIAEDVKKVR